MLGAASATARPRLRSMLCLANTAAWAELPRAQVTTRSGGLRVRRATNSFSGSDRAFSCRRTISGASLISAVMRASASDIAHRSAFRCDERFAFGACESQSAADRVGGRRHEMLSHACGKKRLDFIGEAADQREARRA